LLAGIHGVGYSLWLLLHGLLGVGHAGLLLLRVTRLGVRSHAGLKQNQM
jgi:hypothetical protein